MKLHPFKWYMVPLTESYLQLMIVHVYFMCVGVCGCLDVCACSFIYLFHFTLIESPCIFVVCGCMWMWVACMCARVLSFTYFTLLYNCICGKVKFGKWLEWIMLIVLFLCLFLIKYKPKQRLLHHNESTLRLQRFHVNGKRVRYTQDYFWDVLAIRSFLGMVCLEQTLFCFIKLNMHNTFTRI